MKTCVSSYSFSKYMKETGCDLIAVATKAKELGFDAIEFTELPGDDKISLAKKLRAHCDEIGLPVAAHSLGADFINRDTEAEIKRVCEAIDVAEILGAGSVRHDVCYGVGKTGTSRSFAVLWITFCVRISAGNGLAMASNRSPKSFWCLVCALILSQLSSTTSLVFAVTLAKT